MRAVLMLLLVAGLLAGGCADDPLPPTEAPPKAPDEETPADDFIDVPDVTGEDVESATADVEEAGATPTLEPDPGDATDCTVEEQDVTGEASSGAEVILSPVCTPPDVTGTDADSALADAESEGFEATFDPDIGDADPAACTVEDQDPLEGAEPASEVILIVSCEVPDVTTLDAETAQSELETAGYTVTFDPEPEDPYDCAVEDQDPLGEADPGTDVTLMLDCPGGDDGY